MSHLLPAIYSRFTQIPNGLTPMNSRRQIQVHFYVITDKVAFTSYGVLHFRFRRMSSRYTVPEPLTGTPPLSPKPIAILSTLARLIP